MSRPLRWVYSALLLAVLVLGAPYWLVRMLTSGRYRAGLRERLGGTPRALERVAADARVVWVHAVSVGEVLAAAGLVRGLVGALPGWTVVVSTTTATGQALAQRRLGDDPGLRCAVFYLPLDFAVLMRRVLRRLSPRLVVLMESELWPNMLCECARAGVPVVVANARISDRSFPRTMRLRRWWRPLLASVRRFLAQGEETGRRLRAIGATPEQVVVTGNLKYDLGEASAGPVVEAIARRIAPRTPVLVAGSTLEGEEPLVLRAWLQVTAAFPRALLILAPRHPDRFGKVAKLVAEDGFRCIRAATLVDVRRAAEVFAPRDVVLLDTVGDLAAVYAMATVAFVGGSLVPAGGHNPLEPARFGVPVLLGPSWSNFREMVETMRARDGVGVVTAESLPGSVMSLFRDPAAARAAGARGQSVFADQAGATERTLRELLAVLGRAAAEPELAGAGTGRMPAAPGAGDTGAERERR